MKVTRITLVILLSLGGGALMVAGCGDGESGAETAAAARPGAAAPVVIKLRPKHRSGVTGTARLVPAGANLKVTLKISKPVEGSVLAHIHTGPCSDEPTATKPRIWASLNNLVDGRSKTIVNTVTLPELQAETSSINVHDPSHALRPLVCGDIPRAG